MLAEDPQVSKKGSFCFWIPKLLLNGYSFPLHLRLSTYDSREARNLVQCECLCVGVLEYYYLLCHVNAGVNNASQVYALVLAVTVHSVLCVTII